jgi:HD-like signal output (HDOD) protein
MVAVVSPSRARAFRNVRDALLHKLKSDDGLFALGAAVARVVQLASSDDEAPQELAHYVLSDVALTQKILRLANTVTYRRVANAPVTTISRAIFLLGFDNVKTSALALLLVDSLASHQHAESVRAELVLALRASLLGRELARRSPHPAAEEAAIAALFKNLGRLLVASHEHRALTDIDILVAAGEHNTAQASAEILGCSFDTLAATVLAEWNIPPAIVQALHALRQGRQRQAADTLRRRAQSRRRQAARHLRRGEQGHARTVRRPKADRRRRCR